MPVRVSVKMEQVRELRVGLQNVQREMRPQVLGATLRLLAFKIEEIATSQEIIRGGKQPPHPTRLTSRTGHGRRSIGVDLRALPRFAEVGSDVVYMGVHETGGTVTRRASTVAAHSRNIAFGRRVAQFTVPTHTRKPHTASYPARPFLAPAAEKAAALGPELLERALIETVDRNLKGLR